MYCWEVKKNKKLINNSTQIVPTGLPYVGQKTGKPVLKLQRGIYRIY